MVCPLGLWCGEMAKIEKCPYCADWHVTLTQGEMLALQYMADDWGDATADAEDDGDLDAASMLIWAEAQRLCGDVLRVQTEVIVH